MSFTAWSATPSTPLLLDKHLSMSVLKKASNLHKSPVGLPWLVSGTDPNAPMICAELLTTLFVDRFEAVDEVLLVSSAADQAGIDKILSLFGFLSNTAQMGDLGASCPPNIWLPKGASLATSMHSWSWPTVKPTSSWQLCSRIYSKGTAIPISNSWLATAWLLILLNLPECCASILDSAMLQMGTHRAVLRHGALTDSRLQCTCWLDDAWHATGILQRSSTVFWSWRWRHPAIWLAKRACRRNLCCHALLHDEGSQGVLRLPTTISLK